MTARQLTGRVAELEAELRASSERILDLERHLAEAHDQLTARNMALLEAARAKGDHQDLLQQIAVTALEIASRAVRE